MDAMDITRFQQARNTVTAKICCERCGREVSGAIHLHGTASVSRLLTECGLCSRDDKWVCAQCAKEFDAIQLSNDARIDAWHRHERCVSTPDNDDAPQVVVVKTSPCCDCKRYKPKKNR